MDNKIICNCNDQLHSYIFYMAALFLLVKIMFLFTYIRGDVHRLHLNSFSVNTRLNKMQPFMSRDSLVHLTWIYV